ncbi:hypothetical protein F4804DRAFT_232415 [Jackrogersella minutella]|nr:hypothetical protein F4804DRAFT_232415 [Jackrogersella minutella]
MPTNNSMPSSRETDYLVRNKNAKRPDPFEDGFARFKFSYGGKISVTNEEWATRQEGIADRLAEVEFPRVCESIQPITGKTRTFSPAHEKIIRNMKKPEEFWRKVLEEFPPPKNIDIHDVVKQLVKIRPYEQPSNSKVWKSVRKLLMVVVEAGRSHGWLKNPVMHARRELYAQLIALQINGDSESGFGNLPHTVGDWLDECGLRWLMLPEGNRCAPMFWKQWARVVGAQGIKFSWPKDRARSEEKGKYTPQDIPQNSPQNRPVLRKDDNPAISQRDGTVLPQDSPTQLQEHLVRSPKKRQSPTSTYIELTETQTNSAKRQKVTQNESKAEDQRTATGIHSEILAVEARIKPRVEDLIKEMREEAARFDVCLEKVREERVWTQSLLDELREEKIQVQIQLEKVREKNQMSQRATQDNMAFLSETLTKLVQLQEDEDRELEEGSCGLGECHGAVSHQGAAAGNSEDEEED